MDFLNRYDNIPRTNGKCLTEIERNKITLCLGAGLNNTEIARELHFDVRTVNKRVQRFAETALEMTSNKRDRTLYTGKRYHLPLPTGPYLVIGFYDIMTGTDETHDVLIRILYPASDQTIKITDQYEEWPNWLPHNNYFIGFLNVGRIWWPPAVKFFNLFSPKVFIPVLQNVEPLKLNDQKFPVIIFSHGIASCRTTYSNICYELASYGFVVVVLEHRDQSACASFYPNDAPNDSYEPFKWISYLHSKAMGNEFKVRNEQLDQRVADISKVIALLDSLQNEKEFKNLLEPKMESQKFVGMLDMDNIIVMGHSFGSATAIQSLLKVDSLKMAICLDAWMYAIKELNANSITKPILFINMQTFQFKTNMRKMAQFISNDGNNSKIRKVLTIKDARHTDQSDIPFFINSFVSSILRMKSKVDPFIVYDLTTALTIDFIIDNSKNKRDVSEKYSDHLIEGMENIWIN